MKGPRLKDLGRWYSGGTPSSSRLDLWDGDVPWLSGKDFDKTRLRTPTKFTTAEGASGFSRSMPAERSVLVLVRGMALAHGLPVAYLPFDAAINQDVRGLVPDAAFEPRFIHYALIGRQHELDVHIDRAAHGTARVRDSIYTHRLSWMPARDEQRRVADFLDIEVDRLGGAVSRVDDSIAALRSRTREIRAGLLGFAHVQRDIVGGTPTGRPRLKHLVNRWHSGATPTSTEASFWLDPPAGTPWAAIGDMSGRRYVDGTAKALSVDGLAATGQAVVPAGTLLFAMYASVGEVAELRQPAAFNQAMLGLTVYDEVDRRYLAEWLLMLRPLLPLYARSNTQDNLNAEAVRNLPFTDADRAQRVSALEDIGRVEREEQHLTASVRRIGQALTDYRTSLIHEAVTGKLDVGRVSEQQMDERLHAAAEDRLDEVTV